jgi:hypothetical protein
MNEQELRASVAAVGPLLPVLLWRGDTLDGRRREQICAELGLVPRVMHVRSLTEACQALWALHPERAVQLARDNGVALPTNIAKLCGTRLVHVARILKGERVPSADKRSPRRTRSQKTVLVQLWVDPQLKHYAQLAGNARALTLSAVFRVAAWQFIERTLPRAAEAGSTRGPAVELVSAKAQRRR